MVRVVKNLPANAGDVRDSGLIPGLGSSPGEGNGNPLQYSCLENPMDRGAWRATVHGVAQNRTQLKWLSMAQVKYMFNFIRSCQTCFQSDYSILYSHKLCTSVLMSPCAHQCLLSVLIAITDVRCYVIVVLICISLMNSEAEHLFIYPLIICVFSLEKYLFKFI